MSASVVGQRSLNGLNARETTTSATPMTRILPQKVDDDTVSGAQHSKSPVCIMTHGARTVRPTGYTGL